MVLPGILTPRLHAGLKAWAEDKRGIAAVEFALIAIPFFFLIFGLLEVSVLFVIASILEHGVGEAARQIRTGELQLSGKSEADFKIAVCGELMGMLNCDGKLKLDVKTFSSFAVTDAPDVIDEDGNLVDDDFGYAPGLASDIVVVRAFYEWDLLIPVLSKPLANMSSNRRLVQATVAFRNEPFGSPTTPPPTP